jgi:hypothetical protein
MGRVQIAYGWAGTLRSLATLALLASAAVASIAPRGREAVADDAPATADELPTDTNKIESLTVEQAERLAKEFPGVCEWIEFCPLKPKLTFSDCLPLRGLKQCSPEVARALAGYSKGPLVLDGLTTLDADTAKALAEFKGDRLSLDGGVDREGRRRNPPHRDAGTDPRA